MSIITPITAETEVQTAYNNTENEASNVQNASVQTAITSEKIDETSYIDIEIQDDTAEDEVLQVQKETNTSANVSYDDSDDYKKSDVYENLGKTSTSDTKRDVNSDIKLLNSSEIDITDLSKINSMLLSASFEVSQNKNTIETCKQNIEDYQDKISDLQKQLKSKEAEKENLRAQLRSTSAEDSQNLIAKMRSLNSECLNICYQIAYCEPMLTQAQDDLAQAEANLEVANQNYSMLQDAQAKAQQYQQQKMLEELEALYKQNDTNDFSTSYSQNSLNTTGVAASSSNANTTGAAAQVSPNTQNFTNSGNDKISDPFGGNYNARITSRFGTRTDPITGQQNTFHSGLDLAAPSGTPLYSAIEGTVITSKSGGGYGNTIIVQGKDGKKVRYAHCSALYATVGTQVKIGDKIAAIGSTGNSTGPHLHLEVIDANGKCLDPEKFL